MNKLEGKKELKEQKNLDHRQKLGNGKLVEGSETVLLEEIYE